MSNIIEFPQKSHLQWNGIEKDIKANLTGLKAPEDMINEVCGEMKKKFTKYLDLCFFEIKYGLPGTLTQPDRASINNIISNFEEKYWVSVNSTLGCVLLDILQLEIELYNYRQKDSDGE